MTHEEIFKLALKKARDHGWRPNQYDLQDLEFINRTWPIIFYDKEFAKAIWGIEPYAKVIAPHPHYDDSGDGTTKALHLLPFWQFNLQQMVVADDPIEYLGENI